MLPRLTAELPADEYRLAAILHPNIWHGHGPGQIRAWLDRARRGGMTLIDPLGGWRQALLAADAVIGDHGSVTYYAAALGTPVLLGAAPLSGLDSRSPAAAFVRAAPRFDASAPPLPQLQALLAGPRPVRGPAEFTTSVPGESAARLRRLFYGMMKVPEPEWPALLEPLPLPPYDPPSRTAALRVFTWSEGPGEISVRRFADPSHEPVSDDEMHTAVPEDVRDPGRLSLADVIFRYGSAHDPRLGGPGQWTAEVLDRHPHCYLAAYVTGPDTCVARARGGTVMELTGGPSAHADPAVYASALHAWLAGGNRAARLVDGGLAVRTGTHVDRVSVRVTES